MIETDMKSIRVTRISPRYRKQKRSKNIVHVSRGSSQNVPFNSQRSFIVKTIPSMSSVQSDIQNSFDICRSIEKTTPKNNLSVDQNVWKYENFQRDFTDKQFSKRKQQFFMQPIETNVTKDHHRKKKKNKKRRRIILCVFLLVFLCICIAIAITLGIVLSQKNSTKTTRSKNAILRWNSVGVTIAGVTGVFAANASHLHLPYGLAFDSSNTLHVVDYYNHRVQKLITGTSMTVTVAGSSNGTFGNTMDRLYLPVDILFDASDNMYITDRQNDRVQFWIKGATSGTTVAGLNATHNISLDHPSAILFGPDSSTIFIADTFNHRIISYPMGIVVAGGNGPGNNSTTLNEPYGLIFDSVSKSFIIPNYNSHNIVRWILGEANRTVIAGNAQGNFGSNSTLLRNPVGVKMDPMGNIYVADSSNHRIQLFMAGQSDAITIAGNGTAGTSANQLQIPFWICLDNQLNLYVSDTFNHRVQKFSRY